MKKLILKTAVSLDGFMEGPDGAMDWIHTESKEDWAETFRLVADADTVVLGRGMYPGYAGYWRGVLAEPAKHSQDEVKYARWADETRHIVFSRELQNVDWSNTEIMRDAARDIPLLKREAGKNIIVYGGASFAGSLIDQGLVDDYHIVVHPVALGGGKPLFNKLSQRRALKLKDAKALASGSVWLSYQVAR